MRKLVAALAASVLILSGCSAGGGGKTVVTFRLWDDQVARAYETSFAAFSRSHPGITVDVQVVPWADYFTKLPVDVSSGTAADIFWTNTSNFGLYADAHQLLPIPDDPGWARPVTALYTRGGTLWGVPQLWDSIALFYNKDLVARAGVDPANLTWGTADDTFLAAARKLTVPGRVFGFNASLDDQAVLWDFVGSNGGTWQRGDTFNFADQPMTVRAVQYVVDLINTAHVSPSAADTNLDGGTTLRLFTQGRLALFQSGPYNLRAVADGATFPWGIAPMLRGPAGRVGVVHGVAAVASAKTRHRDATMQVLKWMGSVGGATPIAAGGYAFPGVTAAQPAFVAYWRRRGVDVRPFLDAAAGRTFPAPAGPRVAAGDTAATPILQQVFLGQTPVAAGLRKAQDAANEAMRD